MKLFLQVSDLHLDMEHPERARDFKTFIEEELVVIEPEVVMVTGKK